MNLFGVVLSNSAPSANYRGESAENRAMIQKITKGRFEYPIISPEAIRNALRETMCSLGLPCNRTRLHDSEQLAVSFEDYPDAERFADDFFMGWLVAASSGDRRKILNELEKKGRNPEHFSFKRDSVLRTNMAVGLEPYRYDTVFTQSPRDETRKDIKQHVNTENSQLLHREVTYTAFQYPFALNLDDCAAKPEWTRALLRAVGQLNAVAGNQARSYFEMAPASIVLRLTPMLVAGFDTYGFSLNEQGEHHFPEVVTSLLEDDLPGGEFFLGGRIVRNMDEQTLQKLKNSGAILDRNPQRLLETVSERLFRATGE